MQPPQSINAPVQPPIITKVGGKPTIFTPITNGIMYLFNFNNASEYSFGTVENTVREADTNLRENVFSTPPGIAAY